MFQRTELAVQQQPIQRVPSEQVWIPAMLAARSPVGATPVGSQQVLKQLSGRSHRLAALG